MSKSCEVCGKRAYSNFCVSHKPKKPIVSRSKPLQRVKVSKPITHTSKKKKSQKTALTVPPNKRIGVIEYNENMTVLRNEKIAKNCKECELVFESFIGSQKYCSIACAKLARKKQTIAKTNKAATNNKLKYISKYGDMSGKILLSCANCKLDYSRYASQVKFRGSAYCSMECKAKAQLKARTKSQLTKLLDAVFSRYVRQLYSQNGYVSCVTCQKSDEIKNMQNGHYISRRFYSTRWDIDNCKPQCYSCNVGLSGNYGAYSLYMINTYGVEIIETLIDRSKQPYDLSKQDLVEKIDFYKKELEKCLQ